jgi:1-acyl-sn-glycerol-3-phosphate acyltransferase
MSTSTNPCLPQRGNRLTKTFGKFMLNRLGWSFDNHLPNIPKQVLIVAPHTSNWDFVIGVLVVFALDIEAHWIGKHTIFAPPFKGIMEWLGGIPVNRKLPNDLVVSTTKRFDEEEKFILGIAPEGTRGRVEKWKQGFYRIASGANVPVVCAYLDYRSKSIGFGQPLKLSGDFTKDFVTIREFYADVTAKFPEKFNLPGED